MTHVTDLSLKNKGKLTLEPDCTAIGSSFTLLSRHVQRTELNKYNGVDLVIPNINLTTSDSDRETLNQYENFSKFHQTLVMHHMTHQMNDLNVASIRISKLKELMNQYETSNISIENSRGYGWQHYFIGLSIVFIIVMYIFIKCKCSKLSKFRRSDVTTEGPSVNINLETLNSDNEQSSNVDPTNITPPRRSNRLMRLRLK